MINFLDTWLQRILKTEKEIIRLELSRRGHRLQKPIYDILAKENCEMELAILDSAVKELQKKKDVLVELMQGSMLYL